MKQMIIGLLALGSIAAQANDCVVKNVWLTMESEANQKIISDQLIAKGYIFDETAESGLNISIGVQKEGVAERQVQGHTEAKNLTIGLVVENAFLDVKNAATAIYDSVSVIGKNSEHLIISDASGNALFSYSKATGVLGSENKSVKRLNRLIPSCNEI